MYPFVVYFIQAHIRQHCESVSRNRDSLMVLTSRTLTAVVDGTLFRHLIRCLYFKWSYEWCTVRNMFAIMKVLRDSVDDQTQVDSRPAGQPEHASLNQCQLIAANRPKLVLWAPPAGRGEVFSVMQSIREP